MLRIERLDAKDFQSVKLQLSEYCSLVSVAKQLSV